MTPTVSVIMPVLNQEAWLGAAIDSVRSQRLTDWELLIVDDGSTDSSRAVAEHYVGQDSARIRLLPAAGNRHGAAAARNAAMAEARGRYVAFLDADDLYFTEKLAEEVRMLDSAPEAAMLYGPSLWRWQDGRRADRVDRNRHRNRNGVAPSGTCLAHSARQGGGHPMYVWGPDPS